MGEFQLEDDHTNLEPLNITRISKISLEHADLRTKSTSLVDVNRRKLVQGMPTQVLQGTSLADWFEEMPQQTLTGDFSEVPNAPCKDGNAG